jgi:hypothetical protein
MSTDSGGCEKLEGGMGGALRPVVGEGLAVVADPLQVLLELGLEADAQSAARIGPLARELLGQLGPRDGAEKILVTQMIATFSRSMFLSRRVNIQTNPKWFALYSAECDRAMNLYRKQMQSLAEYRRPRRRTFTAIRTANIAGQQMVLSGEVAGGRAKRKDSRVKTMESGVRIDEEERLLRARLQAQVPADGRGEGGAAGGDL